MESRTQEQLYQIAEDWVSGRIFTHLHIKHSTIGMVFMPIMFMSVENLDKLKNDIGLIYEYLGEEGPRACNGEPMFVSCRMLNKSDTQKVLDFCKQIEEHKKSVKEKLLGGKENGKSDVGQDTRNK